jgi:hypothetical protein
VITACSQAGPGIAQCCSDRGTASAMFSLSLSRSLSRFNPRLISTQDHLVATDSFNAAAAILYEAVKYCNVSAPSTRVAHELLRFNWV